MNKIELLNEIKQMTATGELTQADILAAMSNTMPLPEADSLHARLKLSDIMYYIGGAIIFLGITVLLYQNWDNFSSNLRVFIALGSFVAAYVVAVLLYRYENLQKISQSFFLLSGLLAPLALNITAKEAGMSLDSDSLQLSIFLILTVVYLGSLWFFRKQTIMLFFGIIFATGLFHFIINLMVGNILLMENYSKIWEYRILVEGLVWIMLGYYLLQTDYKGLTGTLYGFGTLAFLGSAMALGGWSPDQNAFWELIYPLLVFGVIFLSVYVKSKSFLVFGTIFLIAYILKLTGEYFSTGLGWPLALVLAGLVIMGVGYYAVKLNKEYFSQHV